jgi:hypothetical protein
MYMCRVLGRQRVAGPAQMTVEVYNKEPWMDRAFIATWKTSFTVLHSFFKSRPCRPMDRSLSAPDMEKAEVSPVDTPWPVSKQRVFHKPIHGRF